jgi:hypothetical protein
MSLRNPLQTYATRMVDLSEFSVGIARTHMLGGQEAVVY